MRTTGIIITIYLLASTIDACHGDLATILGRPINDHLIDEESSPLSNEKQLAKLLKKQHMIAENITNKIKSQDNDIAALKLKESDSDPALLMRIHRQKLKLKQQRYSVLVRIWKIKVDQATVICGIEKSEGRCPSLIALKNAGDKLVREGSELSGDIQKMEKEEACETKQSAEEQEKAEAIIDIKSLGLTRDVLVKKIRKLIKEESEESLVSILILMRRIHDITDEMSERGKKYKIEPELPPHFQSEIHFKRLLKKQHGKELSDCEAETAQIKNELSVLSKERVKKDRQAKYKLGEYKVQLYKLRSASNARQLWGEAKQRWQEQLNVMQKTSFNARMHKVLALSIKKHQDELNRWRKHSDHNAAIHRNARWHHLGKKKRANRQIKIAANHIAAQQKAINSLKGYSNLFLKISANI